MFHTMPSRHSLFAGLLLVFMAVLAGGAALRESATIDEVAHIGAGVSYLQKLDLRFNEEHPPLAKIAAALPLVATGTRADYTSISWTASNDFLSKRVLWTGLIVLGAACLASRLNLSYRHFSVPLVLLIPLLAALPPMLRRVSRPRLLVPLTAALRRMRARRT